jgi:hypothetical protein
LSSVHSGAWEEPREAGLFSFRKGDRTRLPTLPAAGVRAPQTTSRNRPVLTS